MAATSLNLSTGPAHSRGPLIIAATVSTLGGLLFGYDNIVISGAIGDDPSPWAKAGVDWFLSWIGPYHLDYDEVHEMIVEGPRAINT